MKLFDWLKPSGSNQPDWPESVDSDPNSETNINNLMKGLAITHLGRQYSAFENYACSLQDLRDQVQIIGPQHWSRAIAIPRGILKAEMNKNLDQTILDSRKYIEPMAELQREQALLTRFAAITLADDFFHNHTIKCMEVIVNNLANHSAPHWPTILDARLYMAREYAKRVEQIVGMVAPKFVSGQAMDEGRPGHGTVKGTQSEDLKYPLGQEPQAHYELGERRDGNGRGEGYVEPPETRNHALQL